MPANFMGTQAATQINPYAVELQDIERRRRLAEALQQQGLQPMGGTEMAGGWAIPRSPMEGVGKLAQALVGAYGQKRTKEEEQNVSNRYQAELSDTLGRALRAGTGSPATSETIMDEEANGGIGAPATINAPAVPPDRERMAAILMEHPGTAAVGQQQLVADMNRKALIAALRGEGQPVATDQPAQPGAPTQTGRPQIGGPAGGVPMEVWLQTDPTGKAYAEQLAKDYAESQKPVVNRGFGVGRMVNGVYVPAPESTTQAADTAAAVETAKAGATMPYSMQQMDVPVYLPGGDQINVKMNATQAHQYQTTGQLPAEIAASIPGLNRTAGPQLAPTLSPKEREAATADYAAHGPALPNNNGRYGRPVVGRTQSQEEGITQQRQKAGGTAADEAFAKDYNAFMQGGAQDSAKQLAQLQDVATELAKPGANLTGPYLGRVPDAIKSVTNPKSIAMRERVEEVVQRSLRAILGAQFTEKEGERLIARAYNPSQPESENAIRVGRLLNQLQQAYQAKQSAARYFETNGTLQGWQGKLPSIGDFDMPEPSPNAVSQIPPQLPRMGNSGGRSTRRITVEY